MDGLECYKEHRKTLKTAWNEAIEQKVSLKDTIYAILHPKQAARAMKFRYMVNALYLIKEP